MDDSISDIAFVLVILIIYGCIFSDSLSDGIAKIIRAWRGK